MTERTSKESIGAQLKRLPKTRLVDFIERMALGDPRFIEQVEALLAVGDSSASALLARRRMAQIRNGKKRYHGFEGAAVFSSELEQLLDAIALNLTADPPAVLMLLAEFIELDASVFERADDSYGHLGDVFRQASTLFGKAARRCSSNVVLPLLLRLWHDDGYGARSTLMQETVTALDAESRKQLIESLRGQMSAPAEPSKRPATTSLMEIADALGDPDLYAEARLDGDNAGQPVLRLFVAQRYLRAGRANEAQTYLPANASDCGGYASDWSETRLEILRHLGRTAELQTALWQEFCHSPSSERLRACLAAAAPEEPTALVERARAEVSNDRHDAVTQVRFYVDQQDLEEAARCVLRRRECLEGQRYEFLLPLAQSLAAEQPLAATVLYRALLETNLQQALSKYYSHGVRYWRKLAELAARIDDWRELVPQAAYTATVRDLHARKTAFWARVDSG